MLKGEVLEGGFLGQKWTRREWKGLCTVRKNRCLTTWLRTKMCKACLGGVSYKFHCLSSNYIGIWFRPKGSMLSTARSTGTWESDKKPGFNGFWYYKERKVQRMDSRQSCKWNMQCSERWQSLYRRLQLLSSLELEL